MAEYKPEHVQAIARAWRNRFISERTHYYQVQGKSYVAAVAEAESDANQIEAALLEHLEARDGSR